MTRTCVGLDIGSSGVRAAEFAVGRRTMLRRFAALPLPEGVMRSGLVVDPHSLAEALRKLWSHGKFTTKNVVIGIANDSVLVRQMDLEWMPPADFRKGLRYQVADGLPVPVDAANLDYYMLDEIDQPGQSGQAQRKVARVMLVAAGREMVDSFVRTIQTAGLHPVGVDLLPFALVRAVTPVGAPDESLEAVVDIGADKVVVVFHQAGRPSFVRTIIGHGGRAVTLELMERYDWTFEEAERTKIVLGLPGHASLDVYDGALPDGDVSVENHPAHEVIAAQVDSLVSELRATLAFFRTSNAELAAVTRIVLTGRASALGGLDETIERELGIPVVPLAVFGRARKPRRMVLLNNEEATLAVPAGLCLGAVAAS